LASSHTGIDDSGKKTITIDVINQISQTKTLRYDKTGEEHYNLISALHKSLRGGDPDAGLYYLARMMMAGDDPLYIGRRLVRFASEDVGLADPLALNITLAALQAYQILGSPEGELALAEAVVYLALCEKSNAIYLAYDNAKEAVTEKGALAVPLKLRNAPTQLMKSLNYGKDYKYPHDYQHAYVDERYLPEELNGLQFYFPTDRGQENIMAERLRKWRRG
jgi:putative ATPase